MSKVFIAKATDNGTLRFNSGNHQAMFVDWLKSIAEKEVRIEQAKNPVSDEMRGYYFSAVIPAVRKTCKEWEHLSSDELHEVLKKQFAYFEAWNSTTKRVERFGTPVMSDKSSTKKAMEFLEQIASYLADCGVEMPDPEEWKKFRDSAPLLK